MDPITRLLAVRSLTFWAIVIVAATAAAAMVVLERAHRQARIENVAQQVADLRSTVLSLAEKASDQEDEPPPPPSRPAEVNARRDFTLRGLQEVRDGAFTLLVREVWDSRNGGDTSEEEALTIETLVNVTGLLDRLVEDLEDRED